MNTIYVYADVMILISIFAAVPMLWAVARSYSLRFVLWRSIVASILGGAASIACVVLRLPYWGIAVACILVFILMVITAFGRMRIHLLCHCTGMLLAECMLLGGVCLFINSVFSNTTKSFISLGCLVVGIVLFIFIIRMRKSAYSVSVRANMTENCKMKICVINKCFEVNALIDSGNMLYEPISQCPVVILNNMFLLAMTGQQELRYEKHMRVVPFRTAQGTGELYCIKAQSADIFINGEWHDAGDVFIGVSEYITCDALVGVHILNSNIRGECTYELHQQ